jgi:hypothetical protein
LAICADAALSINNKDHRPLNQYTPPHGTHRTLNGGRGRHGEHVHPVFAKQHSRMHALLWIGLPVSFFLIALALHAVSLDAFIWWVNDELGFGENLTAASFAVSAVLAGWLACAPGIREVVWLRASFWLLAVLAIVVAGEEVSWGQHFFNWQTPEWMAEHNKQDETNLHNMADHALDQKPRAVASIMIFLGGALVPLLRARGRLRWLDRWPVVAWLTPEIIMVPVALLVFVPRIFDRIQLWFGMGLLAPFDIRTRYHQELQETFISMTVFLYLLALVLRVRRWQSKAQLDG